MTDKLNVWLDSKDNTQEGHIFTCALLFKGKKVWGPVSCHDNTIALKDALNNADNRFDLELKKKDRTLEGHTRYISVKAHGKVYLEKLSTHENMQGLVAAVDAIIALDD
ncbi:hypothetical protein BBO_08270 [Beauveria brongniartii RCEF 3172]|uniref:Uncharacterized protein n=1 Tax=Beauveria brongniartii RCEF 3172 TaxID=1081107 RepID=A0A166Y0E4_9HYPO|nr:hypothetical protein BBO_08270 [Beauveria brongniartii RCEF 3172]